MSNLQDNTVVLDVIFHKPMRTRRGSMDDVEVDADKDSLTLGMDVIRSDNYLKCEQIQREFDRFVRTRRVKSPFRKGVYLVPIGVLDQVYARLEEARAEYDTAADALRDQWPELMESAKTRLRGTFKESSMPDATRVRAAFWVEWKVMQFQVPNQDTLGEVLYKQEAEKAKQMWGRMEEEVSLALRQGLNDLLEHLVKQLSDKPDGGKSKLKQVAVDKVNDFLETFAKRNVLNDKDMMKLVDKAKKVLEGKDASDLKESADKIKIQLGKVTESLGKLITTQKRAFDKD